MSGGSINTHEFRKEKFVFIKYITRKEIEAVKILKTPVLEFIDIQQTEEILEGDALDNWLSGLIQIYVFA